MILWHAADEEAAWSAESKPTGGKNWRASAALLLRTIDVGGVSAHRVYQATLTGLPPGEPFEYRVLRNSQPIFTSHAKARSAPGQSYSMAVLGDISQNSQGQKNVAYQMGLAKPDFFVAVGDVVYSRGRVSEYYRNWFPIYNCDKLTAGACAPILRSVTTVAIPGNHDTSPVADFGAMPDLMAYFYYWAMPLNGPVTAAQGPHVSQLKGPEEAVRAFSRAAPAFPRMGMYSFDYGDVHWTMLDSNPYVDWTDPKLREWVKQDLRSAAGAKWRFVGLHHPPLQSSKAHFNDQWMRLLSEIFEEEKVDIVFSGHVHNYQRTFPMRFKVDPADAGSPMKKGAIGGVWTLDREFDGVSRTKPAGILWVVTGAGGAGLYNPEQENDRSSWQEFTARFVSTTHSFSMVDVTPSAITLRQIAADGREIDRFRITR